MVVDAAMSSDEAEVEKRLEEAKRRIASQVSDLDPGDVDLILRCLLRPFGSGRRFFLRELRPGVLVF
jgi:hypothetical protein